MKLGRWLGLTTLAALSIGVSGVWKPAIAVNFNSAEVDQSRFVLVATAGGTRLTVLEQISSARPCWRESGTSVEPLLLNFDFTGICGRSTDRNGYSVRVSGQDLGLQYSLRTSTVGNDMVLYAVPSNRSGTWLEVGRARGMTSQFGRIQLNPEWRITRRTYNGEALGHIYLTSDRPLQKLIAANSSGRPTTSTPVATAPTPAPTTPIRPTPPTTTPSQPGRPTASNPIVIPVPPPENPAPAPRPTAPSVGQPVAGSPLPPAPPVLVSSSGEVAVLPVPGMPPTPMGHRPPSDPTIPVVGVNQNWGGYPPVFTSGTPQPASPLASALGFSYRVVVTSTEPEAQRRIREIVPDAFRTVLNGQVVMQAGLFRDRPSADQMLQRLSSANLPASVVPVSN